MDRFVVLERLEAGGRFYTRRIEGVDPECTITGERAYRVVAETMDEGTARRIAQNSDPWSKYILDWMPTILTSKEKQFPHIIQTIFREGVAAGKAGRDTP